MAANYDNSAWFYDNLARLIYGKSLVKAQVFLLQYIQPNSTVLIAGGGTGWILEELARIYPSGLKITYVEISEKMLALSQKRNYRNNEVIFINKPVEDSAISAEFDVIITPFLFDNFTEQTLKNVFKCLHHLLKPGGLWLNADFQLTGKWWQNILLKTMFAFFRLVCGIEARRLPQIEKQFTQKGYNLVAGQTSFGEFIVSKVLSKN
jgi:ubiquinone/menaquinone biosynthesis C-methylase UbiE